MPRGLGQGGGDVLLGSKIAAVIMCPLPQPSALEERTVAVSEGPLLSATHPIISRKPPGVLHV